MSLQPPNDLPNSPWVLLDDTTVEQTAALLEKLTHWLLTAAPADTASLAQTLSAGDTDAAGIGHWVDALAARLRHCEQAAEL
ncbi:MAG TPA: hypothetical protein VM287_10175 [Egibacteraceae bacterium]|nr:hypothetical protein [Egibacteraceae bacterium]